LTEQLSEFFGQLTTVGDKAVEAIKEQIDIETDGVEKELQANTPTDTGGLKASLVRSNITKGSRYGYRLEYEGNDPNGTPYAKVANILNNGTSTIKPKRFLTKAIRKLNGLDDRAAKRFEEKLKG
jgi:HK97 gp10 family phage protein